MLHIVSLGIDPSTSGKTAWAVGDANSVYEFGKFSMPTDPTEMLVYLTEVMTLAQGHGADIVVVENQYVGKRRFFNEKTETWEVTPMLGGLPLMEQRGWWRCVSTAFFIPVSTPSPAEWRSEVMGPKYAVAKRAEAKRAAVSMVKKRFGLKATQDEAEAIAMMLYGAGGTLEIL